MKTFSTTNYEDFGFITGNRTINERHLNVSIMSSAKRDGIMNHILVNPTKVDGKWVIVDGQHRFTACERLGIELPVSIASRDFTLNEIITMNVARKNWTPLDRVKSFAQLGKTDYIQLLDMYNEMNDVTPTSLPVVTTMCSGVLTASQSGGKRDTRGGQWKFESDPKFVRKVFKNLVRIKAINKDVSRPQFASALMSLMKNEPEFNFTRFLKACATYPSKLQPKNKNKIDMIRMIEDLYNHNRSKRVYFNFNNL